MKSSLEREETALRRRLLVRLLRNYNFDAPKTRGEPISDPIARELIAADVDQFEFNRRPAMQ